jgi:hypothetical protein
LPHRRLAILLLCLLPATPAPAVITRHDRADALFVAKAADLPSYCRMLAPDGGGALVAPDWIITAAHLAPDLRPGARVECGAETLTIERVVPHPLYEERVGRHDIALVHLVSAARTTPILTLYTRRDEKGLVVSIIGHFTGGTGLTGGDKGVERKLRGATNRVAVADRYWLRFAMDPPGSRDATDLEGVSGAGDSGAPAYLIEKGRPYLLGVGSRSVDRNRNGIEGDYGDEDLYVRVSSYARWIESVINPAEAKNEAGRNRGGE